VTPVRFALAVHDHQPVGNFDHVFEEAFGRAYLPFLEVLERHPGIPLSLHHSGVLLEWIERHHPDYVERVARLAERGQVELLTGGFYEPILSAIPERDRIGQIEMLSDRLERRFGARPSGLWLAERVWEPDLPRTLARAGVDFTLVDDTHFLAAGHQSEELTGPFLTEDQGDSVAVFPIDMKLRYLIPFHDPAEVLSYLEAPREEDRPLLVMGDDGEKFGLWPSTDALCYGEGWLDRFFGMLEDASHVEMVHLSAHLAQVPPRGLTYLPTASYHEMTQWAMPPEAQRRLTELVHRLEREGSWDRYRPYVKGGFWRGFLARYQEANWMHKRMMGVSERIAEQARGENPPERLSEARDRLYRAQCNCAYWHGVFGGLYLPHIRTVNYANLIEAERLLSGSGERPTHVVRDLDRDGRKEIVVENGILSLYVAPHRGGAIREIDYLPAAVNLSDTLRRTPELYHDEVGGTAAEQGDDEAVTIHHIQRSKEKGLEGYLVYDRRSHFSLVDHFFPAAHPASGALDGDLPSSDAYPGRPYLYRVEEGEGLRRVHLEREASPGEPVGAGPVRVRKILELASGVDALEVDYEVVNRGERALEALFGVEWCVNFQAGRAPDRFYRIPGRRIEPATLDSRGVTSGATAVEIVDGWRKVKAILSWEGEAELLRFPLETVSLSEGGYERIYQGSVVLPRWSLSLGPGSIWRTRIRLRVCEES
jgi:hypothetical protein